MSPSNTSVEMVSAFYGVDKDILDAEKSMFVASTSGSTGDQCSPPLNVDRDLLNAASDVVSHMTTSGLDTFQPVLYEVATILALISVTSCSAERSFSAL